jgi:hypothetical protein
VRALGVEDRDARGLDDGRLLALVEGAQGDLEGLLADPLVLKPQAALVARYSEGVDALAEQVELLERGRSGPEVVDSGGRLLVAKPGRFAGGLVDVVPGARPPMPGMSGRRAPGWRG